MILNIKQATSKGYATMNMSEGGRYIADLSYPSSKTRRERVQDGGEISPTITTEGGLYVLETERNITEEQQKIIDRLKIRKLTPDECFILMGLTPEDCQKCRDVGLSNTALYKAAGNGLICQCVSLIMEHLYKALEDENYVCYDENFQ